MISLSNVNTSILRQLVDEHSMSRANMIRKLNLRGIFAALPDGSKTGAGEYYKPEPVVERSEPVVERSEPVVERSESLKPMIQLPRLTHHTDALYDVLVTNHLRVTHNLYFGPPHLTDIHTELLDNRTLLEDIRVETARMRDSLTTFTNTIDTNRLNVPVSNKLGTSYDLVLSPTNVLYERPFFKCIRVDEAVYVFIEFLITDTGNVDMIEIELPYEMRAQFVPFQLILRSNDGTGEFSGMARAYGRNRNKLYLESYLFSETTDFFVNIEGNYLTTFDQPFHDNTFKWITPVKHSQTRENPISYDMVRLLPHGMESDLGFSDGHFTEVRTMNRVDLCMFFKFSQRTSVLVPIVHFEAKFPTLNDRVYGMHVNGYGTCFLPEHRLHTIDPPKVTIQEDNRLVVRAYPGSLPFHDIVIQAQVSYYSMDETERVRQFEKPIIMSTSSISHSDIQISNIEIYDAFYQNMYQLFNQYNIVLKQHNDRSDYDEYRPTPLKLTLDFTLTNRSVEVSNMDLFNQLDQYDRRYLYPRRKGFRIALFANNFVNDYDGPYDVTPDFTQYI